MYPLVLVYIGLGIWADYRTLPISRLRLILLKRLEYMRMLFCIG